MLWAVGCWLVLKVMECEEQKRERSPCQGKFIIKARSSPCLHHSCSAQSCEDATVFAVVPGETIGLLLTLPKRTDSLTWRGIPPAGPRERRRETRQEKVSALVPFLVIMTKYPQEAAREEGLVLEHSLVAEKSWRCLRCYL